MPLFIPNYRNKKPKQKRAQPESALQIAAVDLFRKKHPDEILFAIPNGGARDAFTASILKMEGVLAGIPDLFWARPIGKYHGFFIETKVETKYLNKKNELRTKRSYLNKNQKKIIPLLIEKGYCVKQYWTIQEFENLIFSYWNNLL